MMIAISAKPHDRACLADRLGRNKVNTIVNDFYNQIQEHPTLAEPFSSVHDWPTHKEKISDFWWVVLGGKPYTSYKYEPVGKHLMAGFNESLLVDWKQLFKRSLLKHLDNDLADMWFSRIQMIGENLLAQNARIISESGVKRIADPTQP